MTAVAHQVTPFLTSYEVMARYHIRLLERIPLTRELMSWPLELSPVVGDEQPMVLLDTETTGLSADDESIIELGM